MDYSKQEFFDLLEMVEDAGGEHLDEQCLAKTYTFCGERLKPATLPGCGNSALFVVPYVESEDKNGEVITHVKACAVDDDMGRWPRFGGDRFGKDKA